jgi:hypothetical protein
LHALLEPFDEFRKDCVSRPASFRIGPALSAATGRSTAAMVLITATFPEVLWSRSVSARRASAEVSRSPAPFVIPSRW